MSAITKDRKATIIKDYGQSDKNTGSTSVQIALLSERINHLTEHLKSHQKDFHSRRGLLMMVAKRNKLLKYLNKNDIGQYRSLTEKLNIRQKI